MKFIRRIRARVHLFALAFLVVALVAACPQVIREPALTAPTTRCTRGDTVCHEGAPWVCGPEGWSQADRRCDHLTDARCCLAASPYGGERYACVPAAACVVPDGGAR